jgi:hypothetical protein
MAGLSSDTKQAFGRMLVFLKTAQTADHTIYPFLTYADTLIVWTEAGLRVMGRFEQYKKEFDEAKQLYIAALHTLQQSDFSLAGWQHEQIITITFKINCMIFPIAMMEGVLVLNQDMVDVSGMLLGSPGVDQQGGR